MTPMERCETHNALLMWAIIILGIIIVSLGGQIENAPAPVTPIKGLLGSDVRPGTP